MKPMIRRLSWRLGRRLYCAARGEPARNLPLDNGEVDLARRVITSASPEASLVIVDVGANIGDWLRPVLDALPADRLETAQTRLFAFEPVPDTQEVLRQGVKKHPRGNLVSIEERALSNACGKAQMATFGNHGGTNSLCALGQIGELVKGSLTVDVTTLTDFVAERGLDYIDLVKIDTEGFDRLVLEGARPLLAAGRISVAQFEYNHRWIVTRSYLKDVFDMIEGLPYAVVRLMPKHVEILNGWHPELERFFEANYAVVLSTALHRLEVHSGRFDVSNTYA